MKNCEKWTLFFLFNLLDLNKWRVVFNILNFWISFSLHYFLSCQTITQMSSFKSLEDYISRCICLFSKIYIWLLFHHLSLLLSKNNTKLGVFGLLRLLVQIQQWLKFDSVVYSHYKRRNAQEEKAYKRMDVLVSKCIDFISSGCWSNSGSEWSHISKSHMV